ncbi:MAG: enolase C-terminal domain-like protein [Burkholderiales bacterium]
MTNSTVPDATRCTIEGVELYERDVKLRMPFRFGVVTLTEAPQAFVRVLVRTEDGREAWGLAAELLAPKWFDKNTALTNEQNFDQLRRSILIAADAYTSDTVPRSAFDHFAARYRGQIAACGAEALNPLVASYGPALLDRAVLDGLLRALNLSFFSAMRGNLPGMRVTDLTPDLSGFDLDDFLAGLAPATTLAARHTVGLVDAITGTELKAPINDGLPETLEQVVAAYGHRYFKLKVGGDLAADLDRLERIASVIDRALPDYQASLDGNEQYENVDGIAELWANIEASPKLERLARSTLFIEQPIHRGHAFERPVTALAAQKPLLIDESDGTLDAFLEAKSLGYTGVSSKACKGFYKSFLNAARCALWNRGTRGAHYFMSAEDLTCQAGVAVQQDLAIVALLGVTHVERNGHHYVNGFAGAAGDEAKQFLAAHPDLYELRAGGERLRIDRGNLAIGSLGCVGFGTAAMPDWSRLRKLSTVRPR